MLNIKIEEINSRIHKVFSNYENTINMMLENKYKDAFSYLENARRINSDIIISSQDYINRLKQRDFNDDKFIRDLTPEEVITPEIKGKFNFYENKIRYLLKDQQERNIKANISINIIARFYIENYLEFFWNKNKDLLFIANLNSEILLEELIKYGQKNILVLNQGFKNVNNFIVSNNFSSKLQLVDSFINIDLRKNFIASLKENFVTPKFMIWHEFQNNLENKFCKDDLDEAETFLNTLTYEQGVYYRLSHEWIRNGLKNLKNIINLPNINECEGKFSNQSVVFVGAGPSLDNDIKYLKKLHNKVYVCASTHSLLALKKNNIKVDFVIHMDPWKIKWLDTIFKEYNFSEIKLLILAATANDNFFKLPVEKKIWTFANHSYDNWLSKVVDKKNEIVNSIAQGHVALNILPLLGFRSIAYLGLDQSYKDGNFNYAYSVGESKKDLGIGRRKIWPSKNGGTVITDNRYIYSIQAFERLIPKMIKKYSGLTLYNCSSEGALVRGFKNISIKDYIKLTNLEKKNIECLNSIENKNLNLIKNKKTVTRFYNNLKKDLDILAYKTSNILKFLESKIIEDNEILMIQELNDNIINLINKNEVIILAAQKYIEDYNQRRVMSSYNENEIKLKKILFVNLQKLFSDFAEHIMSLSK